MGEADGNGNSLAASGVRKREGAWWCRRALNRHPAFTAAVMIFGFVTTLWIWSYSSNFGIGICKTRRFPSSGDGILEASLVRAGIVFVLGGTRLDSVATYDQPHLGTSPLWGEPPLYAFDIEPLRGNTLWWPTTERPAPWAGLYVYIPFWMLTVPSALGIAILWPRRRRPGCPACGYPRTGLAAGALCPECGAVHDRDPSGPASAP